MKSMKKLIPAMAMLIVSAVVMSTASYAWFSMNKTVSATGMQVNAKVSSNLLIAGDTLTSTSKLGDEKFSNSLSQDVNGTLEPVSTTDGKKFFYTTNALANGAKASGNYEAYVVSNFRTAYAVDNAVGYVDYVFQLKAVNSDGTDHDLKLSKLNLQYQNENSTESDNNKAYRVAVFSELITDSENPPTGNVGDLVGIYTPAGAENQKSSQAVNAAGTLGDVNYNKADKIASVAANSTQYYKVVVRLFLEGEDKTCTNATFLKLTKDWKLSLELSIDTADVVNTNVSNITMDLKKKG